MTMLWRVGIGFSEAMRFDTRSRRVLNSNSLEYCKQLILILQFPDKFLRLLRYRHASANVARKYAYLLRVLSTFLFNPPFQFSLCGSVVAPLPAENPEQIDHSLLNHTRDSPGMLSILSPIRARRFPSPAHVLERL